MQPFNPDNKANVRRDISARIEAVPCEIRQAKSVTIAERLLSLTQFSNAKAVLLYASFGCEVETLNLIAHCLSMKMKTGLPKVMKVEDRLRIFSVQYPGELRPGCWGIPEPLDSEELEMQLDEVDIAVVPGVAFDEKCNRLGHGKGYYDRLLGSIIRKSKPNGMESKPLFVGLAYEEQIVPSLYCGPYDIKMDAVITEKRTIFRDGP